MALPTSRIEFKEYVKRRLGEPVITVNVSDDQIEERIDDALSFYQDYHYDASERIFLKHQLTYSNLSFTGAATGQFSNNELAYGETSGGLVKIHTSNNTSDLTFNYTMATHVDLIPGETLRGKSSNASGTVGNITLGDWDNQYVPISDLVLSVIRVTTVDGFAVDRGTGLFSWNYQFMMNDLSWLSSSSVISYSLTRQHMEMLNDMFIGDPMIRFNRHVNKLYLDVDWNHRVKPGDYLVVEAIRVLDPDTYNQVWTDRFLRDYTTALVKKQWGQNLLKYEGVQMPGGVTLNGQRIYEEGEREKTALEEQMQTKYELPPEWFMA